MEKEGQEAIKDPLQFWGCTNKEMGDQDLACGLSQKAARSLRKGFCEVQEGC